jgi:hypothetical protein
VLNFIESFLQRRPRAALFLDICNQYCASRISYRVATIRAVSFTENIRHGALLKRIQVVRRIDSLR